MRDAGDYAKLLRLLLDQTRLQNVRWDKVQGTKGDAFLFRTDDATAGIETLNTEGTRLRFFVADGDGKITEAFVTEPESRVDEAAWDDAVRELWDLLNPGRNPLKALINQLESLPPF